MGLVRQPTDDELFRDQLGDLACQGAAQPGALGLDDARRLSLVEEIRSRGYWHVVVRPAVFQAGKVEYVALKSALEASVVRFRGWDFPHISQGTVVHRDRDWIRQEVTFRHYREVWRLHQSGQFVHMSGMLEDWLPQEGSVNFGPGERLGVGHTLFRMTEVFEFAARLALGSAGDEIMVVVAHLFGLKGRKLWSDKNSPLGQMTYDDLVATVPDYRIERRLSRAELAAQSWELAVGATGELFNRFGWTDSL